MQTRVKLKRYIDTTVTESILNQGQTHSNMTNTDSSTAHFCLEPFHTVPRLSFHSIKYGVFLSIPADYCLPTL